MRVSSFCYIHHVVLGGIVITGLEGVYYCYCNCLTPPPSFLLVATTTENFQGTSIPSYADCSVTEIEQLPFFIFSLLFYCDEKWQRWITHLSLQEVFAVDANFVRCLVCYNQRC